MMLISGEVERSTGFEGGMRGHQHYETGHGSPMS